MTICDEGARNLICGIVRQTADDYKNAVRRLRRNPVRADAMLMIDDCKRFLMSAHFGALTGMDGRQMLRRIRVKYGVHEETEG